MMVSSDWKTKASRVLIPKTNPKLSSSRLRATSALQAISNVIYEKHYIYNMDNNTSYLATVMVKP